MRPYPFVLAAACQAAGSPRSTAVELRAGDEVIVRVVQEGTSCTIDPPGLVARREGDTTSAGAWSVGAAAAGGRELRGPQGVIARALDEPGPPHRLSLIDPVGVPLVLVTDTDGGADVTDGARAHVATLVATRDHVRITGDGLAPAEVIGSRDLALAAVLAVAHVPPVSAAVYACDRLTPAK